MRQNPVSGKKGIAIARLQDEWLGEVQKLLQKEGAADNTVIVVMADHGIRTRHEDPAFAGGMIDNYSFQVPLLIHSVAAFGKTRGFDGLTSHVDIAPTLESLLGLATDPASQGAPIDCFGPQDKRLVPFFADFYLGADGYTDGAQYCMFNSISDASYCSDRLQFDATHQVTDPVQHAQVKATIHQLQQFQERHVTAAVAANLSK